MQIENRVGEGGESHGGGGEGRLEEELMARNTSGVDLNGEIESTINWVHLLKLGQDENIVV